MKMKLKNKKKVFDFKINFTKRNLFLFLLCFLIISMIIGVIFYLYLNSSDKEIVFSNIKDYFLIKSNYDYFNLFKNSLFDNIINNSIIWLLGISIIGIIIVLFYYFSTFFSLGFVVTALIDGYSLKGLIGIICYFLFSKFLNLFAMFFGSFFALIISIKLFKLCFLKQEINIRNDIKKYYKVLIVLLLFAIISSISEVFIDPFMIKIFTFI